MWKKRLIATVTFLAGLYYFLEFVVPATLPWNTTTGVVLSKSPETVTIGQVQKTGGTMITDKTVVTQVPSNGEEPVQAPADTIKAGDVVSITTPAGPTISTISGIVLPGASAHYISVGKLTSKIRTVKLNKDTLIRRVRLGGACEEVKPKALNSSPNCSRSVDWVSVGGSTYLTGMQQGVNDFFLVLISMAWGMGLLSLWLVHSTNIRKKRPEWFLSVIFFAAVFVGVVAGVGFGRKTGWTPMVNDVVFWQILQPVGSSIFSLLTFYLASAAYRSFKAKSNEAVLMMVSALVVMLGQISLHWTLTSAATWILYIINSAAVRGMWFGMMLGGIAVGLRMWLSLERGAFFDREM